MRQKKKPDKKERNYSVWFTGIILVLAYIIILDDMSGAKESACKSILKNQILDASETVLDLMQENLWKQEDDAMH